MSRKKSIEFEFHPSKAETKQKRKGGNKKEKKRSRKIEMEIWREIEQD
jgi:hypothetical protein